MAPQRMSTSSVRSTFPPGTELQNPVTGESARILEHTPEQIIGEMLVLPGGAVAGAHRHPVQEERFEVVEGVMGYRRGDQRGELRPGASIGVPAGVVHDWWNAGEGVLRARVIMIPSRSFAAMIGAVWGLAELGRTNDEGMPELLDAALLAEAFGDEIVFQRPPRVVQRILAATVAPIARRRGRSVSTLEVIRAAIVTPEDQPRRLRPPTS